MPEDKVHILILSRENVVLAESAMEDALRDFTSITYTTKVNGWGAFSGGVLYAASPYADYLDIDNRIVVLRQVASVGDFHVDFVGLIRRAEWSTPLSDIDSAQIWGREIDSIVNRYIVEPPPGLGYSTKSGWADLVIKEYVQDQVVTDATKKFDNFIVGGNPTGTTTNVERNIRNQRLSNLISNIRDAANDFDYKTTIADDYSNFIFDTYAPQYGRDLRVDNPDGDDPMIFSIDNGNMTNPRYWKTALDKTTEVIALGQGYLEDRQTIIVRDEALIAEYGLYQTVKDARNTNDTDEIESDGVAALEARGPEERMTFGALDTDSYRYWTSWRLGDRVTGRYLDKEADFHIDEIRFVVSGEGLERITPHMRQVSAVRTI